VLLTDTVGFIRRLPHDLVDAFHATLEEAAIADLVIHVLDASDPDVDTYFETTMTVLKDMEADKTPMIVVLNKIDLVEGPEILDKLKQRYTESIAISAKTGAGLEELARRMDATLSGGVVRYRFPNDRHDLAALLHRSGTVVSENYGDDFIEMEARVGDRLAGTLRDFSVE
jgi:GTP-binding protein HflX